MTAETALEVRNLSKTFGDVRVLADVTLSVSSGEIIGLVGRNGAGKSTLIKILSGYHTADPGSEVRLFGSILPTNVAGGERRRIAVIQQDLGLCEDLSVLENFGVSSSYGARYGRIGWKRERRHLEQLMRELGMWVDASANVGDLHPPAKAMVAVLRAMRLMEETEEGQPLLVLDEPTVYMGPEDRDRLFLLVRRLVESGGAAMFVSHRIGEVIELCDRITVLRDGAVAANIGRREASLTGVVNALLGDEAEALARARERIVIDRAADLELRSVVGGGLTVEGLGGRILQKLSFAVAPGEVLGFTGLVGMGQEEVPYVLVGDVPGTGSVRLGNEKGLVLRRPAEMFAAGVVVVPADRNRDAIWREGSARENLTISYLGKFSRWGVLQKKRERAATQNLMDRFAVRPCEPEMSLDRFSGGNQQKILMARVLSSVPRVLLLHEPTQGVDVGARGEIWLYIRSLAEAGACVVVCSSDVEEVASICSRVLVLRYGSVVGEVGGAQVSEGALLIAMNAEVQVVTDSQTDTYSHL